MNNMLIWTDSKGDQKIENHWGALNEIYKTGIFAYTRGITITIKAYKFLKLILFVSIFI